MSVARNNDSCPSSTSLRTLLLTSTLLLLNNSVIFSDAKTYNVKTDGDPYSLSEALNKAGAGDTISLADGVYTEENLITVRGGEEGKPLVIVGGKDAVINSGKSNRGILVTHSWVTLAGFSVDGKVGDKEVADSYVGKCVYVQGQEDPTTMSYGGEDVESSLVGFVMEDMFIHNCGDECVRLRNFVTNSMILNNEIENCGIHDYHFESDGKNGEGIYIGTSSNQWKNGPDGCNDNFVNGNTITTNGNECVDIKEGATGNVIEDNLCSNQRDTNSGCFDSRGDKNTFRYNTATNCRGQVCASEGGKSTVTSMAWTITYTATTSSTAITALSTSTRLNRGRSAGTPAKVESAASRGKSEREEDTGLEDAWDQPCSS